MSQQQRNAQPTSGPVAARLLTGVGLPVAMPAVPVSEPQARTAPQSLRPDPLLYMQNGAGQTAVMLASVGDRPAHLQFVRGMLDNARNTGSLALVNMQDRAGNTAVHYALRGIETAPSAVFGRKMAILGLLEAAGADPTLENKAGESLAKFALRNLATTQGYGNAPRGTGHSPS